MKKRFLKLTLGVALCNGLMTAIYLNEPAIMAKADGEETSLPSGSASIEAASSEENASSEEAISNSSSQSLSSEDAKKEDEAWKAIEEYIKELERQIESFNSTKFLNGTIGGLISSALTLLVYAVIKFAEKKGWKTRTELFSRANGLLDTVQSKVDDLHSTQKISEEQYETATKAVTDATALLSKTNDKLADTDAKVEEIKNEVTEKYQETLETVQKDYAVLMAKYEKLLSMLLEMAKSSPDMIKSGTYEKMVEINSASDSTEGE